VEAAAAPSRLPVVGNARTVLCGQRDEKIEDLIIETDMNFRIIIFMLFCFFTITLNAQTAFLTESENDLFWQPNVKINFLHYQAEEDSTCVKFYERYGMSMASSVMLTLK
jgi:hypothetical protein